MEAVDCLLVLTSFSLLLINASAIDVPTEKCPLAWLLINIRWTNKFSLWRMKSFSIVKPAIFENCFRVTCLLSKYHKSKNEKRRDRSIQHDCWHGYLLTKLTAFISFYAHTDDAPLLAHPITNRRVLKMRWFHLDWGRNHFYSIILC